jgi:hypothetical protein
MTEIISKIDLLPIEYPFRKAMGIYTKRLSIILAVVLANLLLLGILLVILRLPIIYLVIAGSLFAGAIIGIFTATS